MMEITKASRIAEAVHDPDWQEFRKSLKGKSTKDKLAELVEYWNESEHTSNTLYPDTVTCIICIRIDNYLKALSRGGQIAVPGVGGYMIALLQGKLVILK
jgi:hypothetical protein